ncbi:MAG: hypothetical protein WC540_01315 [Sulfuritalea sp.]
MGTLVAMRIPSPLFANLADHTYVQCGTGRKAWGCFGRKVGGTLLRQGPSSTAQADQIAGPDECAGITCYFINGVCHQAANRILYPARFTVRGARGYSVSESLYGPYGRPRGIFGLCRAPFERHEDVSGDIPECRDVEPLKAGPIREIPATLPEERAYLEKALDIYSRVSDIRQGIMTFKTIDDDQFVDFQLELFMHRVDFVFSSRLEETDAKAISEIRRNIEFKRLAIEGQFERNVLKPQEFVEAIDQEVATFQTEIANALTPQLYKEFFGLKPGELVLLSDPEIIRRVYGSDDELPQPTR